MIRCLALFCLIITSPICLLIALALWLQSRTPVIFQQERIGLDQKEFVIYKFKTMEGGRITPIGRILRKLGLDEIPQLYNIIKGQMAFVGPRPLTQKDIHRLNWQEQYTRWSVLPGITGLAQLSNTCNARLSLQNDLHYIRHKSFSLDLKLFIRSLLVPFFGKRTQ